MSGINCRDTNQLGPRACLGFLLAALFWSVVIAGLAYADYRNNCRATLTQAETAARQNLNQIMFFHSWAGEQGEVYLPVGAQQQPNSYLGHHPERDAVTPTGRRLTMVTPISITRQINEMVSSEHDMIAHITSLQPLRAENSPDAWEEEALQILARGVPEHSELREINGHSYLRLIRPVKVESACVTCHLNQAGQEGSIMGGISVSVPWEPYQQLLRKKLPVNLAGYGAIWLLGLLGLLGLEFGRRGLSKQLTQRLKMEENLRLTQQKLQQSAKMEAVGTLAAGVAHDFNNILTAQISFVTLAKRRHRDDEVNQEYLQEILNGAKRAAELTRSLLAFSHKQEIRLRDTDLNDIVEKNRKMLRRVIREDVAINTAPAINLLPVKADQAQIEQVLLNLAVNAQDAMPDGGTLSITTSLLATPPTEQITPADALEEVSFPCAVLTMADTGNRIDEAIRERIFEPFFTTKEVGKGTGLGLAMAYGIMQQHGGGITVESEPGRGSVFRLFLPLRNPEEQPAKAPTPLPPVAEPAADGAGVTVLLVEDDHQVRRVLRRIMEQEGYQVWESPDGAAGLELFARARDEISLLVTDVIMPEMNGREAFGEMRRLKPELKVLFVSGYSDDILSGQDIAAADVNFIAKPVHPQAFLAKIREVLKTQS